MKSLQEKVKIFCEKNNMQSPGEYHLLDLYSELGELSKELLKATNYGRNEFKHREEIKEELGDVMYSLITVANSYNVDLEKELNNALEKYQKRIKKGSADSEND